MSERKVINKYIAPDFDPRALPGRKRSGQIKVRVMLPCSVQCNFCGDYVYKGKKFNARSEICKEDYLGIKMFRFYIKCTTCSSEIVFRTDPQNSDYVVEGGATRNFEPWKQEQEKTQMGKDAKAYEEKGDTMKALENRTLASKREMDIIDALEEIRELNARAHHLDTDQTIEKLREHQAEKDQAKAEHTHEDDEAEIAQLFGNKQKVQKRLVDVDDEDEVLRFKRQKAVTLDDATPLSSTAVPSASSSSSSAPSASVVKPDSSKKSASAAVGAPAAAKSAAEPMKPLFAVRKKKQPKPVS